MEKTPSQLPEWRALKRHKETLSGQTIRDLFGADDERVTAFTKTVGALRFDYSKNFLTSETVSLFADLADALDLNGWRDKLFSGGVVNFSEQRPALHTALRASNPIEQADGEVIGARIVEEREKLFDLSDALRDGSVKTSDGAEFKHIIFLGIGGSSLGPAMLIKALGYQRKSAFDVHIVSNIDAHALMPVLKHCDPKRTLLVVASKTFTTTETLTNADTVQRWFKRNGVTDVSAHMMGVTAAPEKAMEYSVKAEYVLPFGEWVGGRYSLWSSISAPLVFAYGTDVFEEFLRGAARMDQHFVDSPFEDNIPILSAILDVWYANFWDTETRALFVYDDRLSLLPDYLQQLETESNGKDRTQTGTKVTWQTSPILWGGVGTDCQHSVFQLMHQGTHLVPVEFVAVVQADHQETHHHQKLLANMFAQSAALALGRSEEETRDKLSSSSAKTDREQLDLLVSAKSFVGNRPSTTILMERLSPEALGSLIAFYEHKVFTAGVLTGINSYDQMGVELGKELAGELEGVIRGEMILPEGYDPSTKALIDFITHAP